MARTNLHELANRLLQGLSEVAQDSTFDGKLRQVSADAGLNSVRSAEAIKLLEDLGRIEVVQRGRRGRNTIITINSTEPVSLSDAESALPSRAAKRATRINYGDVGRAVVDRLLELARDDALRSAQVEAFAAESAQQRQRIATLEEAVESAEQRETDLRIRLRTAEEALERAEENLRRAFAGGRPPGSTGAGVDSEGDDIPDDEARALLDILRSGRG